MHSTESAAKDTLALYLFEMFISICLSLIISSASGVFVRIVNVYEGVYLDSQLKPSTKMDNYWDFEGGTLWNRDRSSKLCVTAGSTLALSSDSSVSPVWSYNEGIMELKTTNQATDLYLTLSQTTAGVVLSKSTAGNAEKILVKVAMGDTRAPLAEKLSKSRDRLKGDERSVRERYNKQVNVTGDIKTRHSELDTKKQITEEQYDRQLKEMEDTLKRLKEKVENAVLMIEGKLKTINMTQQNMTGVSLPFMEKDIEELKKKPGQFKTSLSEKELEDTIVKLTVAFNTSTKGYLNRHRYLHSPHILC